MMIAWNNVELLLELKPQKEFCGPNKGLTGTNRDRNEAFQHFFSFLKEERLY